MSGWLYSIRSRAQTPSSVFSAMGSVSGTEAQITTGIIKLSTITVSCCTFSNRWYKCNWSISGILARLYFLQEIMSRPGSAATPAHGVSRGGQQPSWWTDDVDYTAKVFGFVLDECLTRTVWQQNYSLKPPREAEFRKAESSAAVRKLVSDLQNDPAAISTPVLFCFLRLKPCVWWAHVGNNSSLSQTMSRIIPRYLDLMSCVSTETSVFLACTSLGATGPKPKQKKKKKWQTRPVSQRQSKPSMNHSSISSATFIEETSGFNGDLVCWLHITVVNNTPHLKGNRRCESWEVTEDKQ